MKLYHDLLSILSNQQYLVLSCFTYTTYVLSNFLAVFHMFSYVFACFCMFSFNLIISTYYWSQFIFHLFILLFNHWRRVVTKAAERMSLEGNISDQGDVVWHTQVLATACQCYGWQHSSCTKSEIRQLLK